MSLTADFREPIRNAPTAHLAPYHFKKGQSGNPGGKTQLQIECRKAARIACPEAIETLVEIMRQKDDVRAQLIAAQTLLDRGLGKVKDMSEEDAPKPLDLSQFPPEAMALMRQALAMIQQARPAQEVLPPEPTNP